MTTTTNQIINIFDGYRMAPTNIDKYEEIGKQKLADRIDGFVNNNKPINFSMLGFPFKSSNTRDKVLSPYPDLGEQLTFQNFTTLNNQIQKVYEPGINISVISDGFVFNDLLGIHNEVVTEYSEISKHMAYDKRAPITMYSAFDFYSNRADIGCIRDKIMQQFGITEERLQHEIMFNPDVNYLYRGMIMFMQEELATHEFPSNNQRDKAVKKLVRNMMLRNEAYSNLVRHIFKDHIRLSMHKSVNDGNKYSIKLINSPYAVHSPWHCAIALDGDKTITMHKKDAIAAGYELVYDGTQPYYFTK